jgi:hypothetical protein
MAHIGRRYGDEFSAQPEKGRMISVRDRDLERLGSYCRGDARGFFDLVRCNQDDLRWCGYAPLYTFLQAVPEARGEVLHYEQWNIDDQSVVGELRRDGVHSSRAATARERHQKPVTRDKWRASAAERA